MVELVSGLHQHISLSLGQLLENDEVVVIVDDDAAIREPLKEYFEEHGLAVVECDTAACLEDVLEKQDVALVLLDIGLPDTDGVVLLPQIVDRYPDVAVVMLTGVSDLQVAMECMRKGANDYLSKPVQFDEIFHVAKKALEKRRLIFENRKYQEDLEEAHFRIQLLHQLSMKMNTVYLSTVELDEILRAILVGITANEGLGFNRAFLAMFDEGGKILQGRIAIGPSCREEAGRVWGEIEQRDLNFLQIVDNIRESCDFEEAAVNKIVRALEIPATETENILIKSALDRRSIKVIEENGSVPIPLDRRNLNNGARNGEEFPNERRRAGEEEAPLGVPNELINLLDEKSFVIVPLYSPGRSFGVIIADNYVTRRPILDSHVSALELFASQASLAIEQSTLYLEMEKQIAQLEAVNQELDHSKDLLVDAERYSALGHMAAQLVHIIRNPITSIGGVSRILLKKTKDEDWRKYLNVIIKETERVESTLTDLFDFVAQSATHKEPVPLCDTMRKTAMLLQGTMNKQDIICSIECPVEEVTIAADMQQLRQALLHLVKNGLEAMPDGGTLRLVLMVKEEHVHISVIDTGKGISDSYIDKAKDPFFTTKTYGTGMGLTLVERVVENHDGQLTLSPHEGGGVEAKVILPLE